MFIQTLVAKFAVEAYMDPARAQGCKSADENPVAVNLRQVFSPRRATPRPGYGNRRREASGPK
jgi:hypothetical protein